MAITLRTGKIGSGKTLSVVGEIVKHLAKGRHLFTNIELNFDELQKVIIRRHRVKIVPEQIHKLDLNDDRGWHKALDFGTSKNPVLVALDEIHLFFNSRSWAETMKKHADLLSFLSQSRKAGIDIIFICQNASTLDKQFRNQAETETYCRHVKDIKVPLVGSLPFDFVLIVEREASNEKVISRRFVKHDKGLFGCYNTLAMLDTMMQDLASEKPRLEPIKLERVPLVPVRVWLPVLIALGAAIYTIFFA